MDSSNTGNRMRLETGSERVFINLLRGFAVFLMLWGHTLQYSGGAFDFFENTAVTIIYSFHMPLFMLISGYLFYFSLKKRNLREILIHRTQAMLHPIVMCGILGFLATDVIMGLIAGNPKIILNGGNSWLSHLNDHWFLWSVLAASIAVALAIKLTRKWYLRLLFVLLGFVLVSFMPNAEMNIYMYPFFLAGFGYAGRKDRPYMKKLNWLRFASLPLFPLLLYFYRPDYYIYTTGIFGKEGLIRNMPNNLYRWLIGFAGCLFVITVFAFVYYRLVPKLKYTLIGKGLTKLGEKSLQIYILSGIVLSFYWEKAAAKLVGYLPANPFLQNIWLYDCVTTVLLAIAFSFLLYGCVRLLERIRVSKILFGK